MKKLSVAQKTAYLSAFTAVAIMFSYVEAIIPLNILPIPGFKLGIANIAILLTLVCFGLKSAILVSLARTVIISLLFASVTSFIFSIVGSMLSIIAMWLLLRAKDKFSMFGVSVFGAMFHNIGQIIVAMVWIGSTAVIAYLPILMIFTLVTGIAIGFVVNIVMRYLKMV